MTFRQALLRTALAVAAVTLVFAGPSLGDRRAAQGHGHLLDFVRSVANGQPTAAQLAAVRALHSKATWNNYGTTLTRSLARKPLPFTRSGS
jgi:hypothetical protein